MATNNVTLFLSLLHHSHPSAGLCGVADTLDVPIIHTSPCRTCHHDIHTRDRCTRIPCPHPTRIMDPSQILIDVILYARWQEVIIFYDNEFGEFLWHNILISVVSMLGQHPWRLNGGPLMSLRNLTKNEKINLYSLLYIGMRQYDIYLHSQWIYIFTLIIYQCQ